MEILSFLTSNFAPSSSSLKADYHFYFMQIDYIFEEEILMRFSISILESKFWNSINRIHHILYWSKTYENNFGIIFNMRCNAIQYDASKCIIDSICNNMWMSEFSILMWNQSNLLELTRLFILLLRVQFSLSCVMQHRILKFSHSHRKNLAIILLKF